METSTAALASSDAVHVGVLSSEHKWEQLLSATFTARLMRRELCPEERG